LIRLVAGLSQHTRTATNGKEIYRQCQRKVDGVSRTRRGHTRIIPLPKCWI